MSHLGNKTKPNTEPEGTEIGCVDETTLRGRGRLRSVVTAINNLPRSVRISTNSNSGEAEIVPWTLAACIIINLSIALPLPRFPCSRIARYLSSLGVNSTTTSGIRSSSPPGEPSTRGTVSVWHVINLQQNKVTSVDVTTLQIYSYSGLGSSAYDIRRGNKIEVRPVYLVYYR